MIPYIIKTILCSASLFVKEQKAKQDQEQKAKSEQK